MTVAGHHTGHGHARCQRVYRSQDAFTVSRLAYQFSPRTHRRKIIAALWIRQRSKCWNKDGRCLAGSQMRTSSIPVREKVESSIREGIRVNVTLCFSQQQAAEVYSASR